VVLVCGGGHAYVVQEHSGTHKSAEIGADMVGWGFVGL
jgi:hypothetical protein